MEHVEEGKRTSGAEGVASVLDDHSTDGTRRDDPIPDGGTPVRENDSPLRVGFHTDVYDFDASYTIKTYATDPNVQVGLRIGSELGSVSLDMTAAEATKLADDLRAAAERCGEE